MATIESHQEKLNLILTKHSQLFFDRTVIDKDWPTGRTYDPTVFNDLLGVLQEEWLVRNYLDLLMAKTAITLADCPIKDPLEYLLQKSNETLAEMEANALIVA